MNKVHVKTGDTVIILSGKDKGKKGKVLEVSPKEGKVIVEGCNMVTKHVKPRSMGEQGGIVKAEGATVCLQSNARLPQMRQANTSCSQDSWQTAQKLRLCKQRLRRNILSKEEKTWQGLKRLLRKRCSSGSDEKVRL